jgi:hypothetical protein
MSDDYAFAGPPATAEEVLDDLRIDDLSAEIERLRKGLKYYADGCHMMLNEPGEWDTVSGEPQNFYCDNAGTATIEDGSIAKKILEGWALSDDDDAPMIPPRSATSAGEKP